MPVSSFELPADLGEQVLLGIEIASMMQLSLLSARVAVLFIDHHYTNITLPQGWPRRTDGILSLEVRQVSFFFV